ncbi:MAG TPA: signal peptide peptidase SppA [Patescibacteria group bacterium]|nr:signal peptide peptidase SppA [Patescibacteria group bacterium]
MANDVQRKKEGGFFRGLLNLFKGFFIMLGFSFFLMLVMVGVVLGRALDEKPGALPSKILLTYTFKSGIGEVVPRPSVTQPFVHASATIRDLTEALEEAAKDDRVKGFVAKIEDVQFSVAQVQELRDAVAHFRNAKKFAYVFGESYGEMASGMSDYYFASGFGQLWLQPVGIVGITGISAQVPFVKGTFDMVGVTAQFGHKGLYKSAPETFTATDMSEPNRMALTALIGDLSRQMVEGIAQARSMTPDQVRQLVDRGPFTDQAALEAKLVDKIGYYDEVLAQARKEAGLAEDDDTIDLSDYTPDSKTKAKGLRGFMDEVKKEVERKEAQDSGKATGKPKIALILGSGEIVSFGGTHAGFGSSGGIEANEVADAFKDAREDKDVAAVVFRIDSPGGSPNAAETIRRAVIETQKAGKPVVVSMGGYAASGGYWVATPADWIVAQPATITGSIGVFGGKFVFADLWSKIGVNWVTVSEGAHAGMWSSNRLFTEEEMARFEATLDSIYESFLQRVMAGRKMTHDQAFAVAEGRAWTGAQAKERGLVDELGGLARAIEVAKVKAKIDPKKDVEVEQFPPEKSTFEMFLEFAGNDTSLRPSISLPELRALMEQAALQEQAQRVKAPPILIR